MSTSLQLAYEVWQAGSMAGRYQTLTVATDAAKGCILDAWTRKVTIRVVKGWIDKVEGEFKVVAVIEEMDVPT